MFVHLPPTAAPLSIRALLKGFFGILRGEQVVAAFEDQLRQYFDSQAVFAFTSGRAAFRMILEVIKNQPDYHNRRQVILPAYTCPVLVKAVQDTGLVPELCDIDPGSLDFEPEQLSRLAGEETLALVHIHLFGLPRDLQAVESAASRSGGLLIEDACQAMGSVLGQRKTGSHGIMGFASFGPGKPLSLGGGGILTVNSAHWLAAVNETIARQPELSQQAPLASLVAWIRLLVLNSIFHPAGWRLATWIGLQKMGDDERNWSYHLRRLTPSQAATGQSALVNLDRLNRSRYQNGQVLYRALKDIPGLACLATPEGAQASYLRFPILVADLERREQIFQQLDAAGIGVGKMYRKTLPEFFPELNLREYPGAAYVARHLLTLPVHQYIKKEHLELMIRTITSIAAVEETSCHSAIPIGLNHVD